MLLNLESDKKLKAIREYVEAQRKKLGIKDGDLLITHVHALPAESCDMGGEFAQLLNVQLVRVRESRWQELYNVRDPEILNGLYEEVQIQENHEASKKKVRPMIARTVTRLMAA